LAHWEKVVKLAQINDENGNGVLLEGVVTIPNNTAQYGQWAGKILTCGELTRLIYAVDANGTVTSYNFGMGKPEDARLVAAGQNLYCLDFGDNLVLKVPSGDFSGFAGDVLLVDEDVATLFLVHWTGGQFAVRQIQTGAAGLEHVQFAPINIPALP
jgi:hypothetical protein